MIYTFITDSEKLKKFAEKRDCHEWQPLNLIPAETLRYIYDAKNPFVRMERFAAYSLLFSAAVRFFNVRITEISRNERGKPYISDAKLMEKSAKTPIKDECTESSPKLFFSISHSEGVAVVTVSDEGEVGVDLQAVPSEDTANRLYNKYFENITFEPTNFDVSYFKAEASDGDFAFSEICADKISNLCYECNDEKSTFIKIDSFLEKFLDSWTISEAVLKCDGRGFAAIGSLDELKKSQIYFTRKLTLKGKVYYISVSKFNPSYC